MAPTTSFWASRKGNLILTVMVAPAMLFQWLSHKGVWTLLDKFFMGLYAFGLVTLLFRILWDAFHHHNSTTAGQKARQENTVDRSI